MILLKYYRMRKLSFTILGTLIFFGIFAQEIPQKISYQGKLLENGNPVTGTKSISFTIDTWTETQNITVANGLYSVQLGSITPIPASIFTDNANVSLQISVEGTDLSPQTEILSVAYAFKAEKAGDTDNIAGNPVSGSPNTNQVLKWNGTQWVPSNDTDNQTLSISGSNLTISDGNTVVLSSSGLTLPYSGSYNGDNDALKITNTGTGELADFRIDNTSSSQEAMFLVSNGSGEVLQVESNGTGDCVLIDNNGTQNGLTIFNSSISGHALAVYNSGGYDAGYFSGDVDITGTLSKGGGSFKIDHPLDPENKYLYHSFVESPDMLNVYNGNITLDNKGEVIVQLPEYFEALNMEYRYQLTCIGGFAPVYIAEKILNNRFKIAGGTSGMEVSWQVTGIRHDPYANQNRIQVEVEKSDKEKGHYIHYKEYKQPVEKSIEYLKNPDALTNEKKVLKK
jgi:hypothetical protein